LCNESLVFDALQLRFHPVGLRLNLEAPATHKGDSGGEDGVTLLLRGGRRVAVRRGFDEELLAQLLGVEESWSC